MPECVDEITQLQAEVLKTLASPRLLEILHAVARGRIEVGRLAAEIGAKVSPTPGGASLGRDRGGRTRGREVRYRLGDPDVLVARGLRRGVLERRLTRLGRMAAA